MRRFLVLLSLSHQVFWVRCDTNCFDSWHLRSSLLFILTRVPTHKKYRILCYPLRSNSGWLPIIVLQRYSVFVDSLYYCKYLPITKIFLDNYLKNYTGTVVPTKSDSDVIATNQRVVAAQRQQRGLVAVTIRGSVLFYSSAIWRPDFRSVKSEFRYLYGVDSIELKTLFYHWKMCRDYHWHWKNTKSKSESRKCQFCWYLTCIWTIRLRDFFDHQELER